MIYRAGIWLIHLVVDVVQMSWRLFTDVGLQLFANGKTHLTDLKTNILECGAKLFTVIFRRKLDSNKKSGMMLLSVFNGRFIIRVCALD